MTPRQNKTAAGFVVLGMLMSGNYIYTVKRERDLANHSAQLAIRSCQFNRAFLVAVKSRSEITAQNQDAQNALLLGFTIQVLQSSKTTPVQDKRTVTLFRAFKKANDKREAYLKTHPLPKLPEDAC